MDRPAPLAVSMSHNPDEIASWVKVGAALVGLFAALWRFFSGPVKTWRKRREEERRTIRYLADAVNALLRERVQRMMPDGDYWTPSDDDMSQQAVRIYEQRNALFMADGHVPPTRDTKLSEAERAEVLELIRRTQAIKIMEKRNGEER